jgi:hypothetical protein
MYDSCDKIDKPLSNDSRGPRGAPLEIKEQVTQVKHLSALRAKIKLDRGTEMKKGQKFEFSVAYLVKRGPFRRRVDFLELILDISDRLRRRVFVYHRFFSLTNMKKTEGTQGPGKRPILFPQSRRKKNKEQSERKSS